LLRVKRLGTRGDDTTYGCSNGETEFRWRFVPVFLEEHFQQMPL
jgi:hypothetical protein